MEIRECLLEQSNMGLLIDSTAFNNCAVVIKNKYIIFRPIHFLWGCKWVSGIQFRYFLFLYKMDAACSKISLEVHRLQLTDMSIFTWFSFFTSVFIWIKKVDIFSHHVNQALHILYT